MTERPYRFPLLLIRRMAVVAFVLAIASCTAERAPRHRWQARPLYAPEVQSDYGMVSTGSIEATRAGVQILEEGGNAIDAAVAAAFALGVSDPGGSGLGGLTYVLISTADGRAAAVDGSTPAPFVVDRSKLQKIKDEEGLFGHTVVSVPTTLATLAHSLERYGSMDLASVLQPAIDIAAEGYRLSPNSIAWARGYLKEIQASSYLRFVILEDGQTLGRPGSVICRPDLGTTLSRIAREGADTFYRGSMADEISADMTRNGGFLRTVDFARYRVREVEPLRSEYRGADILAFPPPGGGAEVVEALNILQTFPKELLAGSSVERLQVLIEAFRIAQSDHLRLAAGLNQMSPLGQSYVSREYAQERARLITQGRAIPDADLGGGAGGTILGEHTTQISVVDQFGNTVALTQTLCRQYGSKVATPGLGFPYNSCLEFLDFKDPQSVIYLQPRKTYPTSMAPTIVRTENSVVALGSAGSDRIPPSVTEVISNIVDREMKLRDAVTAPRVLWNSAHDTPRFCLEIADSTTEADADALTSMGFEHRYLLHYPPDPLSDSAFFGGVNAVEYDRKTGIFTGAGDPRRNGFAFGPRVAKPTRTDNE